VKLPAQFQQYPGSTEEMVPRPRDRMTDYEGSGLLEGRCALITGGDSGIGRAVAIAFAKEGADVAFGYLCEEEDADETQRLVEAQGVRCIRRGGDLSRPEECEALVAEAVFGLGSLDILVNHAGTQYQQDSLEDVDDAGMLRLFAVNVFAPIRITRAALRHLDRGSSIINTASVTALRGSPNLLDYSASKGAILSFTYALASSLASRGIRVNAVAPGPVWTPLIPATFDAAHVQGFGSQTPMGRPAQADEIAPSYVFLASDTLSSYYSGQVLAPVGGEPGTGR
jgi:NAD(P)-dependent dehydrogenase (short-subunit alcohol dehydrogenase family)